MAKRINAKVFERPGNQQPDQTNCSGQPVTRATDRQGQPAANHIKGRNKPLANRLESKTKGSRYTMKPAPSLTIASQEKNTKPFHLANKGGGRDFDPTPVDLYIDRP